MNVIDVVTAMSPNNTNMIFLKETDQPGHMIVYCALSLLIIAIGIPANSLSLSYFILREETKISKMIFIWLNAVDLFVCLWMVPQAILTYSYGEVAFLRSKAYCAIRLATYPSALQLSIFITQLLCLTRTFSLLRPLAVLQRRYVTLAMVVFVAVIAGRVVDLFVRGDVNVGYSVPRLRCSWVRTGGPGAMAAVFNTWNIFLSCCMLIPTAVGCVTAVVLLLRSRNDPRAQSNPLTRVKREANVTVVIITIVCLVGYLQFIVMTLTRGIAGHASIFLDNLSLIYACSAVSAINPVIYFVRIKRLRHHAYWVLGSVVVLLKLQHRFPDTSSKDTIRVDLKSVSTIAGTLRPDPVQRSNTLVVALPDSSGDEETRANKNSCHGNPSVNSIPVVSSDRGRRRSSLRESWRRMVDCNFSLEVGAHRSTTRKPNPTNGSIKRFDIENRIDECTKDDSPKDFVPDYVVNFPSDDVEKVTEHETYLH